VVQSIGLFIVPPFVLAWLFHGKIAEYLYLKRNATSTSIFLVAVLVVFALPLINFIGEWNTRMEFPEFLAGLERWMKNAEDNAAELTEAFLKVETTGGLLLNLVMIAVLPAIGEELAVPRSNSAHFYQLDPQSPLGHLDFGHPFQRPAHSVLRVCAAYAAGCFVWLPAGLERLHVAACCGPLFQQRLCSGRHVFNR
jgi:hypothetical protein